MIARYPGICACGAAVSAGSPIHWDADARRIAGCAAPSCTGRRPAELRAAGPARPTAPTTIAATVEVVARRATRETWAACTVRLLASAEGAGSVGDEFPATGQLAAYRAGTRLDVTGTWRQNGYGRELRVASATVSAAVSESDVQADPERALRTMLGGIEGLGRSRIAAIARDLGGAEEAIRALVANPAPALARCQSVPAAVRAAAVERLTSLSPAYRASKAFLCRLGLGPGAVEAALRRWKADAERIVRDDPYRLMLLPRVGWVIADGAASGLGIVGTDDRRLRAAACYALQSAAQDGHCWIDAAALADAGQGAAAGVASRGLVGALATAGLSPADVLHGLDLACVDREVEHNGRVAVEPAPVACEAGPNGKARWWLAGILACERDVADDLRRLASARVQAVEPDESALAGLDPDQARAVQAAAERAAVVVTGGPGTGKTHTTRAILRAISPVAPNVVAVAPTGKAALRLSELIGLRATTIHRALGFRPGQTNDEDGELDGLWTYGRDNPLTCDAVVCDEVSMLDVALAARLLSAVPTGARLILVGDVDQLASVGPGAVLRDVLDAGGEVGVEVVRLRTIHRQASESAIPHVAAAVNAGKVPDWMCGPGAEWNETDEGAVADEVVRAVCALPNRLGVAAESVQVLAPTYAGRAGIDGLNASIQKALCPRGANAPCVPVAGGQDERDRPSIVAGDRVIATRNSYTLLVWNGEIGRVVEVDPGGLDLRSRDDVRTTARARAWTEAHDGVRTLEWRDYDPTAEERKFAPIVALVEWNGGGRTAGLTRDECHELRLGYAISVHKSQGSQWPAVVVVVASKSAFVTRSIVYTALTRAESLVLAVGQTEALGAAVVRTHDRHRRTELAERLNTCASISSER